MPAKRTTRPLAANEDFCCLESALAQDLTWDDINTSLGDVDVLKEVSLASVSSPALALEDLASDDLSRLLSQEAHQETPVTDAFDGTEPTAEHLLMKSSQAEDHEQLVVVASPNGQSCHEGYDAEPVDVDAVASANLITDGVEAFPCDEELTLEIDSLIANIIRADKTTDAKLEVLENGDTSYHQVVRFGEDEEAVLAANLQHLDVATVEGYDGGCRSFAAVHFDNLLPDHDVELGADRLLKGCFEEDAGKTQTVPTDSNDEKKAASERNESESMPVGCRAVKRVEHNSVRVTSDADGSIAGLSVLIEREEQHTNEDFDAHTSAACSTVLSKPLSVIDDVQLVDHGASLGKATDMDLAGMPAESIVTKPLTLESSSDAEHQKKPGAADKTRNKRRRRCNDKNNGASVRESCMSSTVNEEQVFRKQLCDTVVLQDAAANGLDSLLFDRGSSSSSSSTSAPVVASSSVDPTDPSAARDSNGAGETNADGGEFDDNSIILAVTTEIEMRTLDLELTLALRSDMINAQRCYRLLDEVQQLKMTVDMLLKYPFLAGTVDACCRLYGDNSDEDSFAELRRAAECARANMIALFPCFNKEEPFLFAFNREVANYRRAVESSFTQVRKILASNSSLSELAEYFESNSQSTFYDAWDEFYHEFCDAEPEVIHADHNRDLEDSNEGNTDGVYVKPTLGFVMTSSCSPLPSAVCHLATSSSAATSSQEVMVMEYQSAESPKSRKIKSSDMSENNNRKRSNIEPDAAMPTTDMAQLDDVGQPVAGKASGKKPFTGKNSRRSQNNSCSSTDGVNQTRQENERKSNETSDEKVHGAAVRTSSRIGAHNMGSMSVCQLDSASPEQTEPVCIEIDLNNQRLCDEICITTSDTKSDKETIRPLEVRTSSQKRQSRCKTECDRSLRGQDDTNAREGSRSAQGMTDKRSPAARPFSAKSFKTAPNAVESGSNDLTSGVTDKASRRQGTRRKVMNPASDSDVGATNKTVDNCFNDEVWNSSVTLNVDPDIAFKVKVRRSPRRIGVKSFETWTTFAKNECVREVTSTISSFVNAAAKADDRQKPETDATLQKQFGGSTCKKVTKREKLIVGNRTKSVESKLDGDDNDESSQMTSQTEMACFETIIQNERNIANDFPSAAIGAQHRTATGANELNHGYLQENGTRRRSHRTRQRFENKQEDMFETCTGDGIMNNQLENQDSYSESVAKVFEKRAFSASATSPEAVHRRRSIKCDFETVDTEVQLNELQNSPKADLRPQNVQGVNMKKIKRGLCTKENSVRYEESEAGTRSKRKKSSGCERYKEC